MMQMGASAAASSYGMCDDSMTLCTSSHAFSAACDMPTAEDLEEMMDEGQTIVPLIEEPKQPRMSQAQTSLTDIRDSEIEAIYETMQEEAMMEILGELEEELAPAYMAHVEATAAAKEAREQLLWDVVATPTMMREFSQHVSAHPPVMVE